jgi:transglutaminase-like putative cysteine protease
MRYVVTHVTTFRYAAPMRYARCNLRLRPYDWPGQKLTSFAITVEPAPASTGTSKVAGYPGKVERIVVDRPTRALVVTSRSELQVDRLVPGPLPGDPGVAEVAAMARASADLSMTAPANYLYPSPMIALTPAITEWCAESLQPDRGIVEAGFDLTRRILAGFKYDGTATETRTTPAEAFEKRAGVCQDFAQVMIAGCRGVGLPAAYVSGYIRTIPPPGKPRLVGADATHAWVMLWCGEARGWIGFDPTNGIYMASDHIVTAVGRDYADIAPIDGIFVGQSGQEIDVSVDVEPHEE